MIHLLAVQFATNIVMRSGRIRFDFSITLSAAMINKRKVGFIATGPRAIHGHVINILSTCVNSTNSHITTSNP